MGKLTGKTALITAHCRELAKNCQNFARLGANLILLDISLRSKKLADELCGRGHRYAAVVADVRDPASVAAAISALRKKKGALIFW